LEQLAVDVKLEALVEQIAKEEPRAQEEEVVEEEQSDKKR
jgi:hypothetical protein